MSTFAQTPQGDLQLDAGKRLTFVRRTVDATAIKLRNRLLFVQGEWFLDTRLGVPYTRVVFVKNPQVPLVRQMFRTVIETCPGIVELLSLSLAQNARTLQLSFSARTSDGFVISGSGLGDPFLIEVA